MNEMLTLLARLFKLILKLKIISKGEVQHRPGVNSTSLQKISKNR